MEITGTIKKIDEEKTFGASGFRVREMVLTTNEQYPQMLLVQFVQDKCNLLDNFEYDQNVKISINLRGREWINPQGEAVYFNTIQGWKIELEGEQIPPPVQHQPLEQIDDSDDNEPDDLPF